MIYDFAAINLGFCADFVKPGMESEVKLVKAAASAAGAGRAARVKKVSGPDWTYGLPPDNPKSLGATVDTGLGPTDGLNAVVEKR